MSSFRSIQILLTVVLLAWNYSLLGQTSSDTLAKDNVMIPLPTVSVNFGFNHAFTDVSLSTDGPSPFLQFGYQLTITQRTTKFLNLGFELYTGSIYGEEQRGSLNLNYRTSLVSPRVNFEYNFYPILKPDSKGRQLIRPYLGFGLGAVFFRSKADLSDKNGITYNYWSNGNIYAEEEGTVDITEATELERDFEYETDLRDANLDGFRKYPQTAFSMPINAGIRFQLSKNVGLNASFAYVLNFTDLIDNVNAEGVGVRQGESGFDNHIFGSIGLSFFLGNTKPSAKPKPRFERELTTTNREKEQKNLTDTESEEQKEDSMESAESDMTATEATDNSGNDSNRDREKEGVNTELDTSESQGDEAETDETSPLADDNTSQSETDTKPSAQTPKKSSSTQGRTQLNYAELENTAPKETGDFHWADLNNNNWISPDEVLHFIDLLFEGEAVRSIEDIQNLIDYYFDQE